jgi:Holliday junction resolvase
MEPISIRNGTEFLPSLSTSASYRNGFVIVNKVGELGRTFEKKSRTEFSIYLKGTQIEALLRLDFRPDLLQCDDCLVAKFQAHHFLVLSAVSVERERKVSG